MKVKNPNTGNFEEVYVKALDSLPVGSEIDFTGSASDIPAGWEQSSGSQDMARATNIDNLTDAGNYSIFRATGTLPAGYSQDDDTFLLDVKTSSNGKIQTLYDANSNKVYTRYMTQYGWSNWITITQSYSTDEQIVGIWIDGKPIYRKVITFTTDEASGSWKTYPSGITSTVDKIINIQATIERSNYINSVPYEESANGYIYLNYVKSSKNITYKVGSELTSLPVIVILEYTKTTD